MPFTTLVDTETVAGLLDEPAVLIVDCRFDLSDTEAGEREYERRHIPGAIYASLDRDLSGPRTGRNGRHPLPEPAALADTFGRLGIGDATQVIAYDQDSGIFASRLWWALRWLGHDAVAVVDGGFAKWTAEGRPTTEGRETRSAQSFTAALRPAMVVGADEVEAIRANRQWRLVDARAPERFSGETETIDKAAGHIPGAVNHFYKLNLSDRGTFRPATELRARIAPTLGDVQADRIVCYCGSGVTACHNLLALEQAGVHGAKLYPGSWSEWSSDETRPTERSPG
jgi:thiosulfate/3-mercaptopyruvate sulfurtransferase